MMAAISSSKPAAPAEKPGIMARIGAGAAGLVTGAAEMVGLGAPVEVAEMAAGRQPAQHFGAPGPFGATAEQVRGVEQQTRGVTPGSLAKGAVQGIVQPFKTIGSAFVNPPQTLGQAYDVGKAVPQAAATLQMGAGAAKAAGGAIAQIPAVARGAEKFASAVEARVAAENLERIPENTRIERLKSMGYAQAPTRGGGGIAGRAAEAVSGQLETEYALSRKNAKVSNRKAAEDIGITGGKPLTEEAIEAQKQKAGAVYDQVRNASKETGRIPFDDSFKADMEKVRERTLSEAVDFPEDVNDAVEKEIKKFSVKDADSASMLSKIKKLRERASANMRGDAEKFELGIAQKKIATALEDQLDRHLETTNPALIQQFRNARQQFAKIYSVEDALTPNGNISPAVLARQLKRGVPLSAGLKDIAEAYLMDKRAHRTVDDLGGKGEFSRLDVLVGGAEMLAHPEKAAIIAAALGARPLARAAITSPMYQARAIGPTLAEPGIAARAARKVADVGKEGQTLASVSKPTKTPKQRRATPGPIGRQRGSFSLAEIYKDQNSNIRSVEKSWDEAGISHSISENGKTISLDKIVVPKSVRGSGAGTKAMQQLVDYADQSGKRIELSPSTDFGASSKSRLVEFYKKFGFKENKGKSKDFSTRHTMIREPK
jgi:GNAT superfamily N-acetyltransferase